MTVNAKIKGFTDFFRDIGLRKFISFTRRRHRRQRHTRLWPMCIMVPMGRVHVICDFRNYNYWTGNAVGFRASRELCSNFLFFIVNVFHHTVRECTSRITSRRDVSEASRSQPASRKLEARSRLRQNFERLGFGSENLVHILDCDVTRSDEIYYKKFEQSSRDARKPIAVPVRR